MGGQQVNAPTPESLLLKQRFDAWNQSRRDEVKAAVLRNLMFTGGGRAVRMVNTTDSRRFIIISRNIGDPEWPWRATGFDWHGPWGHTVHKRQSDAIRSYSGQRIKSTGGADACPGDWLTVEVRR